MDHSSELSVALGVPEAVLEWILDLGSVFGVLGYTHAEIVFVVLETH